MTACPKCGATVITVRPTAPFLIDPDPDPEHGVVLVSTGSGQAQVLDEYTARRSVYDSGYQMYRPHVCPPAAEMEREFFDG